MSETDDVIDLKDPAVKEAIAAAVASEVEGLKNNRDIILQEKKDLATKLDKYKDIDPDKVHALLEKIGQSEDAQLIADGKLDELIDKRTSTIREAAETQIAELTGELSNMSGKYDTVNTKYNRTQVDRALQEAAVAAGIRSEAISDVLLRGSSVFTLGEDGTIEARDSKGELRKDAEGIILDPTKYIAGLRKTAPHYWPDSSGSGVTGQGGSAGDLQARIDAAAKSGDMTQYRKLREKQATGK